MILDPRKLLTPLRLDIVVKHRFFKALMGQGDADAERVYRWHIEKRTGGVEPRSTKTSVDDYVLGCRVLLDSLLERGFDEAHAVRFGQRRLLVNGGAHRVAASL